MVRGLRLFVRPIEAADTTDLQAFFAGRAGDSDAATRPAPACGLLGKLLAGVIIKSDVSTFASEYLTKRSPYTARAA